MGLTGLFFGSFNPVHNGHLTIARYLLEKGYCENIWFVISPQNPWKKEQGLLDEQKRLELVKEAIREEPRMRVCDIEFSMPRPSYTYQTLRKLKEEYPETDFALVIGGDNLQNFRYWKNYEEISSNYVLFVYPRPGIVLPEIKTDRVVLVDAPLTAVSSTEIRRKVEQGEDISGDVPALLVERVKKYYAPDRL